DLHGAHARPLPGRIPVSKAPHPAQRDRVHGVLPRGNPREPRPDPRDAVFPRAVPRLSKPALIRAPDMDSQRKGRRDDASRRGSGRAAPGPVSAVTGASRAALKTTFFCLFGLALWVTGARCGAAGPAALGAPGPGRPNILFIMADDHAAHAISAYGSRVN